MSDSSASAADAAAAAVAAPAAAPPPPAAAAAAPAAAVLPPFAQAQAQSVFLRRTMSSTSGRAHAAAAASAAAAAAQAAAAAAVAAAAADAGDMGGAVAAGLPPGVMIPAGIRSMPVSFPQIVRGGMQPTQPAQAQQQQQQQLPLPQQPQQPSPMMMAPLSSADLMGALPRSRTQSQARLTGADAVPPEAFDMRMLMEMMAQQDAMAGKLAALQGRDSSMDSTQLNALESVVKILVVSTTPNYLVPWQVRPQREASGSGFVIDGRRIITNAHVVSDYSTVRVRKHNSAELFPARVLSVADMCDLAMLTVEDNRFWEGLVPLQFARIPQLYQDVMVIGYPIGGDNVCVTRGVVSRIDTMAYSTRPIDNITDLPVVQIDAPINFGNSGGPACSMSGDVVGVAFCTMMAANNVGYIIPLPVIRNFIEQYEQHSSFVGVCELGVAFESMMNETLRRRFGMKPEQSGVLVIKIEPLAAVASALERHDVLMAIDDVPIANDATVVYEEGNNARLHLSVLVTTKRVGSKCKFTILRKGEVRDVVVEMHPTPQFIPRFNGLDASPSFFVYGGLVFMALSLPLVNQMVGSASEESTMMVINRLRKALSAPKKESDAQCVVLMRILITDMNYGYGPPTPIRLKRVNGQMVKSLRQLIDVVYSIKDSSYVEFAFDSSFLVVIDRAEADASEPAILEQHNIAVPASKDLRDALAVHRPQFAHA